MAKRRIRKGNFCWGDGFVEDKPPFSGPKLRALADQCYDLIATANDAEKGGAPGLTLRYPFERYGHGFLLAYDHERRAWLLHIAERPPPPRRRGRRSP